MPVWVGREKDSLKWECIILAILTINLRPGPCIISLSIAKAITAKYELVEKRNELSGH